MKNVLTAMEGLTKAFYDCGIEDKLPDDKRARSFSLSVRVKHFQKLVRVFDDCDAGYLVIDNLSYIRGLWHYEIGAQCQCLLTKEKDDIKMPKLTKSDITSESEFWCNKL